MGNPITDDESMSEHPMEFDPRLPSDERTRKPTATIVYAGGSERVSDFEFIEEILDCSDPYADMPDEEVIPVVRVWYSDPSVDDSDYVDYDYGNVVEVSP